MESAPDLLQLLVQALARFSQDLNRWLSIPWPMVIGVLFLPVISLLNGFVWYLRGMAFPISCGYPRVRGRGRCQRLTLGEWHKCWYHGRNQYRKTDNHIVDPKMKRWDTGAYQPDEALPELMGRGFLSMRSSRDTLLYCQGFARPPRDVFSVVPEVLGDYKVRVARIWDTVRSVGLRGLVGRDRASRQVAASNVLPSVISATRLVLALVALGLVLVGVSIVAPSWTSAVVEYCATFAFITALMVGRSGIWKADLDWAPRALRGAAKGMLGFTGIAALSGALDLYADHVRMFAERLMQVGFLVFAFAILLGVIRIPAIGLGPKSRSRRRRRRRRW